MTARRREEVRAVASEKFFQSISRTYASLTMAVVLQRVPGARGHVVMR